MNTSKVTIAEAYISEHMDDSLFCIFIDCVFVKCTFTNVTMCRFKNCTFIECVLHRFKLCDLESCHLDSCQYRLSLMFQSCDVSDLEVTIVSSQVCVHWRLACCDEQFMSALLGHTIQSPNYCWNDYARTLPMDVLSDIRTQLEPYKAEIDHVFSEAHKIYEDRLK